MTVSVVAGQPSIGPKAIDGIQWAPLSKPERLAFNGTSLADVSTALTAAFGNYPIRLSKDQHLNILYGMVWAAGTGRQPYSQIHDALQMFGELEITCV